MATPTYDLLDSTTLSSSASSVTFSSIDQSYRDLVLVCEYKGSGGNASAFITLNSDTGSNYPEVNMYGYTPSTAGSTSGTNTYIGLLSSTTTEAAYGQVSFMDYSATDKHTTTLARFGRASTGVFASACRWANTSAVSTMTITAPSNSFAAGSTFYLYGIAS